MPDEDPKPRKFRLFKDHEVTVSTDIAEEWDKVKSHFRRNKVAYISGGVFLTVGLLAGRNFQLNPGSAPQIVNDVSPVIAPVFNNDNSSIVNLGGTMSKIVKRSSDGKIWESATEAAREMGKPLSVVSKHLNKYPGYEFIDGDTLQFIGLRTAG